jgi:hypothetical protein
VEPLTLPVRTFHGSGLCKVHTLGHPALRAVGKRRGFHEFSPDPEFPAVDAEPAVLERFLLLRKALDFTLLCRQDAIVFVAHGDTDPRMIQYVQDENKKEIFALISVASRSIFIDNTILKTIQSQT